MIKPQVAAIHSAIQYIESHLREEITVEDIAAAAGYSLYHFIRRFNQTVHHTPYDYLMRRRLSESAKELVDKQRRILDVALDFQFNNHETFSRAFKRMFAMQPSKWRGRGLIPYRSLLPALSISYLEHINQGGISNPQFIVRDETNLVGLMNRGHENDINFWQNFKWALAENEYPKNNGGFYRIHMLLQDKVSFSFVGIEAVPGVNIFPPLSTLHIPSGSYVQFSHRGMKKELTLSLDYIYHTWLAKSNHKLLHPLEIEHFPDEMPLADNKIKKWYIQLPICTKLD